MTLTYINDLAVNNVMMLIPMPLHMQSKPDHQAGIVARRLRLLEPGRLHGKVDSELPLDEISAAHQRLDTGRACARL